MKNSATNAPHCIILLCNSCHNATDHNCTTACDTNAQQLHRKCTANAPQMHRKCTANAPHRRPEKESHECLENRGRGEKNYNCSFAPSGKWTLERAAGKLESELWSRQARRVCGWKQHALTYTRVVIYFLVFILNKESDSARLESCNLAVLFSWGPLDTITCHQVRECSPFAAPTPRSKTIET